MGTIKTLSIAGHELPMREIESKNGNPLWGVLGTKKDGSRYLTMYGVKIPALDSDLPEFVEVDGERLFLESGETGSGNPKMSAYVKVVENGKPYTLAVNVSDIGPDEQGQPRWNLIAKVFPRGGGGGNQKAVDLSSL